MFESTQSQQFMVVNANLSGNGQPYKPQTCCSSRARHLVVLCIVLPDCASPDVMRGTYENLSLMQHETRKVQVYLGFSHG